LVHYQGHQTIEETTRMILSVVLLPHSWCTRPLPHLVNIFQIERKESLG
jgi:hypothetical protein